MATAADSLTALVGNTVRIRTPAGGEFGWKNPDTDAETKADPAFVYAYLLRPNQTSEEDISGTVAPLTADGGYYVDILLTESGTWRVRFKGTGIGPQAATAVAEVFVRTTDTSFQTI